MNIVVWLLPFIVFALGYIFNKVNFFKPVRTKIYVVMLLCAFLCDLMSLSFVNGYADTIFYLVVAFILCDIGFSILRTKKIILKCIVVILGATAFICAFSSWVMNGPSKVMDYYVENQLATFVNDKHHTYAVRQRIDHFKKSRTMTLYRIKKVPILEERIREYEVPEAYISSEYTFGWSSTEKGVRLDLISGKDTLWTLGENF